MVEVAGGLERVAGGAASPASCRPSGVRPAVSANSSCDSGGHAAGGGAAEGVVEEVGSGSD